MVISKLIQTTHQTTTTLLWIKIFKTCPNKHTKKCPVITMFNLWMSYNRLKNRTLRHLVAKLKEKTRDSNLIVSLVIRYLILKRFHLKIKRIILDLLKKFMNKKRWKSLIMKMSKMLKAIKMANFPPKELIQWLSLIHIWRCRRIRRCRSRWSPYH